VRKPVQVHNLIEFAIIFPSIVLHEISHGYVAYRLGDPTAKRAGRLTLNPLSHIDLLGTVVLPIMMLVLSGGSYFFGWAKPVPIDPRNFRNERAGMLLTAIAGPAMNVVLAIIVGLMSRAFPAAVFASGQFASIGSLLAFFCYPNLVLAFFNLIPIPPLDGSRVVEWFLPDTARNTNSSIARYGFVILIGVTWMIPGLFNAYLAVTVVPIFGLLTGGQ
jgi:Zn-dependent protease